MLLNFALITFSLTSAVELENVREDIRSPTPSNKPVIFLLVLLKVTHIFGSSLLDRLVHHQPPSGSLERGCSSVHRGLFIVHQPFADSLLSKRQGSRGRRIDGDAVSCRLRPRRRNDGDQYQRSRMLRPRPPVSARPCHRQLSAPLCPQLRLTTRRYVRLHVLHHRPTLTYSTVLTDRFRNLTVGAVWMGNIIMTVGTNLGGVRWVVDPVFHIAASIGNSARQGLRFFEAIVSFGLASLVILVSYVKILLVVRQHHIAIGTLQTQSTGAVDVGGHRVGPDSWKASILLVRSLFIIVAAYYICYLPANANFQQGLVRPIWYMAGSIWLLSFSGVANGLLYIIFYKSTRRDFVQTFCAESCLLVGGNATTPDEVQNVS